MELRKVPGSSPDRPLAPGQGILEQQVGVGADAEMQRTLIQFTANTASSARRRLRRANGAAAAEIDQTDEQADQHAEGWPKDVKAAPDSLVHPGGSTVVTIKLGGNRVKGSEGEGRCPSTPSKA